VTCWARRNSISSRIRGTVAPHVGTLVVNVPTRFPAPGSRPSRRVWRYPSPPPGRAPHPSAASLRRGRSRGRAERIQESNTRARRQQSTVPVCALPRRSQRRTRSTKGSRRHRDRHRQHPLQPRPATANHARNSAHPRRDSAPEALSGRDPSRRSRGSSGPCAVTDTGRQVAQRGSQVPLPFRSDQTDFAARAGIAEPRRRPERSPPGSRRDPHRRGRPAARQASASPPRGSAQNRRCQHRRQ